MFTPGGIGATLHHDTPEGRADHGVLELGLGEGLVGRRLRDLRLRDPDAARRRLALVLGDDLLARQVLRQPQLPPVLAEVGLGALHGRARAGDRGLVVDRLEPGEDLALAHDGAFLDAQLGEPALDLGGDHRLAARYHVAGGGQDRRAGARLHVAAHRHRDGLDLGRGERLARAHPVEDEDPQGGGQQQQQRPAPGARALAVAVDLERGKLAFEVRHVPLLKPEDPGCSLASTAPRGPGAAGFGQTPVVAGERMGSGLELCTSAGTAQFKT
jgi:hypothetical protein